MANTGYKGYATLEQYYVDNNSATGTTKPNVSTDTDYIAPVYDAVSCPVANTTISLSSSSIFAIQALSAYTVDIVSNYDELNFSVNVGWVILSPSGYSNDVLLTIDVEENTTCAMRYAEITIYHGLDSIGSILIRQAS